MSQNFKHFSKVFARPKICLLRSYFVKYLVEWQTVLRAPVA